MKQEKEKLPGFHWEVDIIEVKPGKYRYKYILVFVGTFSVWVEAFSTKRAMVSTVIKIIEELTPRYGFPSVLGSDNGSSFISRVTQNLVKVLGAN